MDTNLEQLIIDKVNELQDAIEKVNKIERKVSFLYKEMLKTKLNEELRKANVKGLLSVWADLDDDNFYRISPVVESRFNKDSEDKFDDVITNILGNYAMNIEVNEDDIYNLEKIYDSKDRKSADHLGIIR
ncbi:hypothetical protein EDD66_11413 [Mobilisporobacter senegalensis]|uniref:Uncharacterized protein n=1 Tax=Mobilisporobacter senegalensis TaxID=1329262 RepID=A0A3N1X9G8_9FIRM|nr:hypothetical protein [Mobilisporobacter senegalensis]ROR23406.1 hypothetical protein EDD66_11413 [Mobilisporobacter senegalensis]